MWWFALPGALFACQEPFELDRHDLVGFRVAAVAAAAGAPEGWAPRVAVITEGEMWAPDTATLRWHLVPDAASLWELDTAAAAPLAEGPVPLLPYDEGDIGLIATHEGSEVRVIVTPPTAEAESLPPIAVSTVPFAVEAVDGPSLGREARAGVVATPADAVPVGGFGRWSVAAGDGAVVRWMATAGTFFELDARTTDWAAGDLRLDGDEIEGERSVLEAGPVSVLALALGEGATRFRAQEVWVGPPGDGLWVEGRWLPAEPAAAGMAGVLQATLEADDASPTGLRATGVMVAGEGEATAADWGTGALGCDGVGGPFDPGWLLTHQCGRDALVGATVYLRATSGP